MFKKGKPVRIPFCNKEGVVEYESKIGNSYLVGVILLKAKGISITPTLKWYQVKDLEIIGTITQYSSTKHPLAELIVHYAQDATETDRPWERWLYNVINREGRLIGSWITCRCSPSWESNDFVYRRKQKTIRIGNKEVNIGDKLYYNNQQGIGFFGTVLELDFDSVVPRIALNKATNGNIDKNWVFSGTKYLTRVLKIGHYDVPEPLREAPEDGTLCYIAYLYPYAAINKITYVKHTLHEEYLSRGLLHLTKEAAKLHAKALLSFTTTEINDDSLE